MVGVFGAEIAVSFLSSGVGLKAGIFGQFWIAQFSWGLPLGGLVCVL